MAPRYLTVRELPPMPAGMEVGIVSHRLNRHFCRPLSRLGKCKRDCGVCQPDIRHILTKIVETPDVQDPYGYLVFLLRERVAEIQEEREARATSPTNTLGETIDRNPFNVIRNNL